MAFTPTAEYWANKIKNIELAITGTEEMITAIQNDEIDGLKEKMLEAHNLYLKHLKKELAKSQQRFASWRNKRQNQERG